MHECTCLRAYYYVVGKNANSLIGSVRALVLPEVGRSSVHILFFLRALGTSSLGCRFASTRKKTT